jgi:hypothetical protein
MGTGIMNKKGVILYWVVPVVFAAIAIFLYFAAQTFADVASVQGNWALEFSQFTIEGEEQLFFQQQLVKHAAWRAALTLARHGGFRGEDYPCGAIDNVPLWNDREEWERCTPAIKENLFSAFREYIGNADKGYQEVGTSGTMFWGRSDQYLIVESEVPFFRRYVRSYNFSVDIGYAFEEYDTLRQQAQDLVSRCRNVRNLKSCLEQHKPPRWKFTSCDDERYRSGDVYIPFCVESDAQVFDENYTLQPVRYHFALDFTPTTPFTVENLHAVAVAHPQQTGMVLISFDASTAPVDEYMVYYVDSEYNRELLEQETFRWDMLPSTVIHGKQSFLVGEFQDCPAVINSVDADGTVDVTQLRAGKGYHCQERIYLTPIVPAGEFFIMVSAVNDGKESPMNSEIVGPVSLAGS